MNYELTTKFQNLQNTVCECSVTLQRQQYLHETPANRVSWYSSFLLNSNK